jgi:hypothetical protein
MPHFWSACDGVIDSLEDSQLVTEAKRDARSPKTAIEALRVVRNNLAHGNRGYEGEALEEVVIILELVVRAHALRILSCSKEIQARVFKGFATL